MIHIDIWSDVNCPYCYIGKRHLEKALESFSDSQDVRIEWKSFELDPVSNPPKGSDHLELLATKYGKDRQWALEMNQNITKMAKTVGLDFQMDKLVPANSFDAHRIIHLAKSRALQDQMKERLLKAKFTEGQDINDHETLKKLAMEVGLTSVEVEDVFQTEKYKNEVREDEALGGELGIRGVPFFVINRKYGLSGAQPTEAFLEVLNKVKTESASS